MLSTISMPTFRKFELFMKFINLDNPRGCGFTKDNYCYRSYQMDTAINWSTAQSRCEDWGGNLTSITSEEENLLIFQRTPINALNCWIGMYSNISGNLTWNDGRNFEYTKWRNAPSTSPPHCVQWNNLGADLWVTTNCETRILKCFICKKFRKLFIPTGNSDYIPPYLYDLLILQSIYSVCFSRT